MKFFTPGQGGIGMGRAYFVSICPVQPPSCYTYVEIAAFLFVLTGLKGPSHDIDMVPEGYDQIGFIWVVSDNN